MKLSEQQQKFTEHLMKLFIFIHSLGYKITLGEALRTLEQQTLYFQQGKSKTMDSMHLQKCAIDLNIFKDGQLITSIDDLDEIGIYWESLDPLNRWGGSWRGLIKAKKSTFVDTPHFERKIN